MILIFTFHWTFAGDETLVFERSDRGEKEAGTGCWFPEVAVLLVRFIRPFPAGKTTFSNAADTNHANDLRPEKK
jgi:hypothetical protein